MLYDAIAAARNATPPSELMFTFMRRRRAAMLMLLLQRDYRVMIFPPPCMLHSLRCRSAIIAAYAKEYYALRRFAMLTPLCFS